MCQKFYWTARLFSKDQAVQSKYFATQEERDAFVLQHSEWKKRGKICAENLEKHLRAEIETQKTMFYLQQKEA